MHIVASSVKFGIWLKAPVPMFLQYVLAVHFKTALIYVFIIIMPSHYSFIESDNVKWVTSSDKPTESSHKSTAPLGFKRLIVSTFFSAPADN